MATLIEIYREFPSSDSLFMISHCSHGEYLMKKDKSCRFFIVYIPCMILHALSFCKDTLLTIAFAVSTLVLGLIWATTCCRNNNLGFYTEKSKLLLVSSLSAMGIDLLGTIFPLYGYILSNATLEKFLNKNKELNKINNG